MANKTPISRRNFLKTAAAIAAASPLAGCNSSAAGSAEPLTDKPNIVFIIADDLGFNDAGYHGSTLKTPSIDALAANGVALDQHYAMPTCTPTRVGIMTGRYPSRYGVTAPAYGKIFDDDTVTIAHAMRQSGYQTFISGKWHMGSPPEHTPLKYGFDHSYGYFAGQIDPYTHLYKTGIKSWHRDDEYLVEQGHATDLITDEAIRIIKSQHKKPFFLYIAYSVPHFPLDEPEEWTSMYPDLESDSRRWYAASVTHMDHGIGRIVDAVDKAKIRKNTLIVFISDNGGQKSWHSNTEYKGRYADKPHDVLGDNLPLRGFKGDVYEGGIRVPGLLNWPKRLKPGKFTPPIHIADWMPTLCTLAGYRHANKPAFDGINLWPAIAEGKPAPADRIMYWKTPNRWAVRKGPFKLVTGKKLESAELFNLADDPLEKRDIASKNAQKTAELKVLLDKIRAGDR